MTGAAPAHKDAIHALETLLMKEPEVDTQTGDRAVTTVMFRNLPRKHAAGDLLLEIEEFASRNDLNFVSVPWDRKAPQNLGFAFVNFNTPEIAHRILDGMAGRVWRLSETVKTVKMVPTKIQGLKENILHALSAMPVDMNKRHRPSVFVDGQKISFQLAVHTALQQQREAGLTDFDNQETAQKLLREVQQQQQQQQQQESSAQQQLQQSQSQSQALPRNTSQRILQLAAGSAPYQVEAKSKVPNLAELRQRQKDGSDIMQASQSGGSTSASTEVLEALPVGLVLDGQRLHAQGRSKQVMKQQQGKLNKRNLESSPCSTASLPSGSPTPSPMYYWPQASFAEMLDCSPLPAQQPFSFSRPPPGLGMTQEDEAGSPAWKETWEQQKNVLADLVLKHMSQQISGSPTATPASGGSHGTPQQPESPSSRSSGSEDASPWRLETSSLPLPPPGLMKPQSAGAHQEPWMVSDRTSF